MKQWQKNEFWDTWWDEEAFNDWEPEVEEVAVIEEVMKPVKPPKDTDAVDEEELLEILEDEDLPRLREYLQGKTISGKFETDDGFQSGSAVILDAYGLSFAERLDFIKVLLAHGDVFDEQDYDPISDDDEDDFFKNDKIRRMTKAAEEAQIFLKLAQNYRNHTDPDKASKVDELFDAFLLPYWEEMVDSIVAAIESTVKQMKGKHAGLKFDVNHGRFYPVSMNADEKSFDSVKVSEAFSDVDDKFLAVKILPALLQDKLQALADKGIFNKVMASGEFPIVIWNRYSNHFARQETIVIAKNLEVLEQLKKEWPNKWEAFEQADNKLPFLGEIVDTIFYGKEIIEPNPRKAMDILFEALYKADNHRDIIDVENMIRRLEDDYGYPEVMYRLGRYYEDQEDAKTAALFYKNATVHHYRPAIDALKVLNLPVVLPPLPIDRYTEEDLFIHNTNIRARANKKGYIKLEFFNESEAAYKDALNYLNHLMEQGYSKTCKGIALMVKFVEEPVFLKVENYPKAPVHAFFAKAVSFPSLHSDIRAYAENTLTMYDAYNNFTGEAGAIVGGFAASALALESQEHLDLLSRYARQTAGEYDDLQLNMIPPTIEKYGVTPLTIPVLFDLLLSYGQSYEIELPPDFLLKENLEAALVYYEEMPYAESQKPSFFNGYIEKIVSNDECIEPEDVMKILRKHTKGENADLFKQILKIYRANYKKIYS